eukprot:1889655-Pleurochrysis_carterae.AAC.1
MVYSVRKSVSLVVQQHGPRCKNKETRSELAYTVSLLSFFGLVSSLPHTEYALWHTRMKLQTRAQSTKISILLHDLVGQPTRYVVAMEHGVYDFVVTINQLSNYPYVVTTDFDVTGDALAATRRLSEFRRIVSQAQDSACKGQLLSVHRTTGCGKRPSQGFALVDLQINVSRESAAKTFKRSEQLLHL